MHIKLVPPSPFWARLLSCIRQLFEAHPVSDPVLSPGTGTTITAVSGRALGELALSEGVT